MANLRKEVFEMNPYRGALYAAGLNSDKMLCEFEDDGEILTTFIPMLQPSTFVLFVSETSTIIIQEEKLIAIGASGDGTGEPVTHSMTNNPNVPESADTPFEHQYWLRRQHARTLNLTDRCIAMTLKDGVGDQTMMGCITRCGPDWTEKEEIDTEGCLWLFENGRMKLQDRSKAGRIGFIARARNGKMAVVMKQTKDDVFGRILQFENFNVFRSWYVKPYSTTEHNFQGRAKQLVANNTACFVLLETGEFMSWAPQPCVSLGRTTTDEMQSSTPTSVYLPGGLPVQKLAAGGEMCAALCEKGELYIWGYGTNEGNPVGKVITWMSAPTHVILPVTPGHAPPALIDIAVGWNHVAVVTEAQELWVIGDNSCGQLALKSFKDDFSHSWMRVPGHKGITRVYAGPTCTIMQKV